MKKWALMVTALFAAQVLIGCSGGTEDSKPPAGTSYYKGEMKPKQSAAPGKAPGNVMGLND